MILLALALLSGACTFALAWSLVSLIAAIIPALFVTALVYFLAARKIASSAQAAMMFAVSEIQKGRVDRGIALLEDVKKRFGNWQFFTKSAINGQIGSIYFMRQDFQRAKPFLEKSFAKHWNARAMLAVLYFRKKDFGRMDQIFETAARYSPKQGLLWSTWAYCHWKAGQTPKAIEILASGEKKLGNLDGHLMANLSHLKNNRKMKMNGYGQEWHQFHLEPLPQNQASVRYVRR
ncbi:MAG: hypothetical protein I8H75_00085 [Myxococcaceae bacterium]|nr:hypothetical protein [Myxococcaceae bacterium]MBH2005743.1 hypothetical protein [Myxococcaceae bacterium]